MILVGTIGSFYLVKFFTSSNPIFMSYSLLIFSSSIFLIMFKNSGYSWVPSILYMLFIGGILVMFMVLSSIMPVAKNFKILGSLFYFLMFFLFFFSLNVPLNFLDLSVNSMKISIDSSSVYSLLVFFVLSYFFVFLFILMDWENSLREIYCHILMIL